jgi:predicted permease
MGLGLGLLGSAFTLLNAYLLKPINLPNPYGLYSLSWDSETTRGQRFTLAEYEALQPEARRYASVAAAHNVNVMLQEVSTTGLLVTGNYFELLGARPALGRLLRPSDAVARGGAPVVVLSHNAWKSRFGSDPTIVGRQIALGRQRLEVVGVTEPQAYLTGQELVTFWAPITMAGAFPGIDPSSARDTRSLVVVGRLRPAATAASMRAWFDVWLRQRIPPDSEAAPVAVRVDSLATRLTLDGAVLSLFVFIMSVFGLVLLVASANVTNLMLARALARQPEIAVRLALGASRWRVARQLIVESLVLAVPAAAAGLGLIMVTARVFPAVVIATFPVNFGAISVENILVPLDPDWRVMAFLAAAAVLSAVLITLVPAGRLAATRLASASRGQASTDVRGSRLRSGLVAMQIGACALFLVAAGGLIDEASRLGNPLPNISFDRVSRIQIDPAVRGRIADRLASSRMVQDLAYTSKPPGMGALPVTRMTATATNVVASVGYTVVSPEYFTLFDIQVVRGRAFTSAEAAAGAPVALVSRATAAALWPGLDPLGQTLDLPQPDGRSDRRLPRGSVRVIGVTEDVATGALTSAAVDPTCVYFAGHGQTVPALSMLVRTPVDDVGALKSAMTAAVRELAPDTPFLVERVQTTLGGAVWIFQAFSVAASLLGVIALLFAYSGTHAVVSFLVAQRRREFGVRMALGASTGQIVSAMMIEVARVAGVGVAAGVAIVFAFVRLVAGSNPIVPEYGPRPFVVGVVVVLAATAVAALLPLRQTARIDPAQALRTE